MTRFRPRGWAVVLVVAAAVASQPTDIEDGIHADRCDHRIVSQSPSADGKWDAQVEERICSAGLGWVVILSVQMQRWESPFHAEGILSVETNGSESEWPHIRWTTPRALHVDVPNAAYLQIDACRMEDVSVDIDFTPYDADAWFARVYGMKPGRPRPPPSCPEAAEVR